MTETIEKLQQDQSLQELVKQYVNEYLINNKGNYKGNLYSLLIDVIEKPMFAESMEKLKYNQTKTAKVLGMSRTAFRYKMERHFDDKYFPGAVK